MQGGKSSSAVGAAKEAVANVGASAWAGKEKTKAVVQETVNKAKAHDPAAKAEAEARKQERIHEVEAAKQDAMRHNAAAKEHATAASYHPTAGAAVDPRDVEVEGATQAGRHNAAAMEHATAGACVDAHDVEVEGARSRAGSSDDGYLPVTGAGHAVGEGGGHQLPARGTPGGRSA
ncbi:hypothetical protein ZWY2020_039541 [Hordeum vulgare]|nr:hypothetical protein ZWY2020_019658 [Hordeum vulgare]KAI4991170.1 hypothetical protein ZWY2020_039541 [Hordeum vulgare]